MFTITYPEGPHTPSKAVAILYGWLGSEPKYVKKYADIYTRNGCTVIYGTAPIKTVMTRNKTELCQFAMESVRKAATIIRTLEEEEQNENENGNNKDLPVILHYFSNGGAFVAEHLEAMIQNAKQEKKTIANMNDNDLLDLKLVANRLQSKGYEILDSAPAYLHDDSGYRAIEAAVPNFMVQMCVKLIYSVTLFYKYTIIYIFGAPNVRDEFWDSMIHSQLCPRQLYIYSDKDKLTDSNMLDDLIEKKKQQGIHILRNKFQDSDHVLHFRKYPQEYEASVLNALNTSTAQS